MATEREIEAAARAMYLEFKGVDPDWPIGLDRNGYRQEPYVRTVPGWKWHYEHQARIALEAAERVRIAPEDASDA